MREKPQWLQERTLLEQVDSLPEGFAPDRSDFFPDTFTEGGKGGNSQAVGPATRLSRKAANGAADKDCIGAILGCSGGPVTECRSAPCVLLCLNGTQACRAVRFLSEKRHPGLRFLSDKSRPGLRFCFSILPWGPWATSFIFLFFGYK